MAQVWYAVVSIRDGMTIAVTQSLDSAATMLDGDSCHGSGDSYKSAVANARAVAKRIRDDRNRFGGRAG